MKTNRGLGPGCETSFSTSVRLARYGVLAIAAWALFSATACNTEGTQIDLGPEIDQGAGIDFAGADLAEGPDMACTPEVASCTGLCGPVRDNCTGFTYQCGACGSGMVCDLDAHACIVPKADCVALGRDCGTTKNSCGQTISCSPFTCTDVAQECDPDTNKCVTCTSVTCQDLGYECGEVWLGCGPASNKTDCGSCATDKNCNNALHVCEPKLAGTCTPPAGTVTPQMMCDAAKAAKNVECGIITNGCGGLIDCTTVDPAHYKCRTGLTCGGAGVPNRCAPQEPPSECLVAGYTCGTLTSACGGTLNCGTCDATKNEVCNVAQGQTAGTCGLVCDKPEKSCAVEYGGMCGKQLDNNCWPKKDCNCTVAGEVCSTSTPGQTGTCGNSKACAMYTDGAPTKPCSTQPSSAFPKGDGTNLTCQCNNQGNAPGQEVCINQDALTHQGTCCQRTACSGNQATVVDACTGQTLNCCTGGQVVYNNQCCTPIANPCEAAANAGKYATGVTDGCGNLVNGTGVCDCSRYGGTPVNPDTNGDGTLDNGGACCAGPSCGNGMGGTFCDGRQIQATCNPNVKNTCDIGDCGGSNPQCSGGLCCTPAACPSDGKYHAAFSPGCGLAPIVCSCSRFGSSQNVNPDTDSNGIIDDGGTCCATPTCGNDCDGQPNAATCNAAVKTGNCSTCASNKCCLAGVCQANKTCSADYPGKCGDNLPDGCGGNNVDCNCTFPATCSTSTPGVEGTCTCPAAICNGCNPATQTNGCGNSANCGCGGGQVCGAANACCAPQSCGNLPAGFQCGSVSDTCRGINIPCGCDTTNKPNSICNAGSHQCDCVPTKCCKDTGDVQPCLAPGAFANDGCGSAGTCSS